MGEGFGGGGVEGVFIEGVEVFDQDGCGSGGGGGKWTAVMTMLVIWWWGWYLIHGSGLGS